MITYNNTYSKGVRLGVYPAVTTQMDWCYFIDSLYRPWLHWQRLFQNLYSKLLLRVILGIKICNTRLQLKVVLQKSLTLHSAQGMLGMAYLEHWIGQISLVKKQLYTLSVSIICSGIVAM